MEKSTTIVGWNKHIGMVVKIDFALSSIIVNIIQRLLRCW